jgi:hypothetical protein
MLLLPDVRGQVEPEAEILILSARRETTAGREFEKN